MWQKVLWSFAVFVVGALPAAATTWDVSLWGKPRAFTAHVERLAEIVAERSGGAFTIELHYGGLAKNRENLDGIAQGSFEMAQFCVGYHPEKTPTLTALELPFLGVSSLAQERAVSEALYAQQAVVDDMARWNAMLLMATPLPQYNIMGAGDAPMSVADLVGKRVRATGGVARALNALGIETVSLTATEVSGALARGEIDAVAFAPHAHMAFDVIDTATWWTGNLNPGTVHCPVVANTDAFDALTREHQALLVSAADEALTAYVERYETKTMGRFAAAMRERGIKTVTISPAELSYLFELASSQVIQQWMEETSAQGAPAGVLFETVMSAIKTGS